MSIEMECESNNINNAIKSPSTTISWDIGFCIRFCVRTLKIKIRIVSFAFVFCARKRKLNLSSADAKWYGERGEKNEKFTCERISFARGALPECNATAHAGRMLLKHRLFSTLNFYGCNKSEFKVVKRSSRSWATESIVVVHQYENWSLLFSSFNEVNYLHNNAIYMRMIAIQNICIRERATQSASICSDVIISKVSQLSPCGV